MADPDDRRLFEHFIVAGLADGADELATVVHECGNKSPEQVAPIVDITVIFPSLGETVSSCFVVSFMFRCQKVMNVFKQRLLDIRPISITTRSGLILLFYVIGEVITKLHW